MQAVAVLGQKSGAEHAQPVPQVDEVFDQVLVELFQSQWHVPLHGPGVVVVVPVVVVPVVVVDVPVVVVVVVHGSRTGVYRHPGGGQRSAHGPGVVPPGQALQEVVGLGIRATAILTPCS